MYNRYLPRDEGYRPVGEETGGRHTSEHRRQAQEKKINMTPEGVLRWLGGILKRLRLEELDSGDVLLVLILLFLFLESEDNLELVIALGLLLVFGLTGEKEGEGKESCQDSASPTV